MSIFGPGVGGGMLAAAGALGGLGKGLSDVGAAQEKSNLETHLNELAQKREEAITRLQGQQQTTLEDQRAGHEMARTGAEVAGRANVAQMEVTEKEGEAEKGRKYGHTENAAKIASEEHRTDVNAQAKRDVAHIHADSVGKGAKFQAGWLPDRQTAGGTIDPVTHYPVGGRSFSLLRSTHMGMSFVPAGEKLIPYDATKADGLSRPLNSFRRDPKISAEEETLLANPLRTAPSGMTYAQSFLKRNGYLPAAFAAAEESARQAQSPQGGMGTADPDANTPAEPEEPEAPSQADTAPPPNALQGLSAQ